MAEDIARLGLELDSSDIKKAITELEKLGTASERAEKLAKAGIDVTRSVMTATEKYAAAVKELNVLRDKGAISQETYSRALKAAKSDLDNAENSTRKLSSGFSAMSGAIAALGVGLVVHEIISINAEFSKLHGALVTVTGSTEAANDVVDRMKVLMTEVPGSLNDLTNSFIKLKALGLDPSERAIISYSNTAAAMGKDLNQMIEAVADAATGEFERLKEFGIKSASEGDRVKFTFQGVTKEVGKNSQEIQDYLLSIGEVQFAGAAAKQMETFGGAIDNLGSQISALAIDSTGMPAATRAINELSKVIADPKTKEGVDGLISGIATLVEWSAKGAVAFVDFGKSLGEFAGNIAAGPIEKQATEALALMRDQQEKVDAMKSTIAAYNTNLETLKKSDATQEQIAAFEQTITAQEKLLEREQRRLDLMKNINQETAKNTEIQTVNNAAIATDTTSAIASPSIDPKLKEKLEKQLETLQEYYMNDEEAALNALLKKQSLITELEDAHIGTEDERRQLRLEATQEYEDELLAIAQDRINREQKIKDDANKREEERVRKNTAFAIRMAEAGNKDATALLKAYLLDQAKMLGQAAIMGAYKWGAAIGGPVTGAAAAGAASLAVGAIISALQSGGGGGSSASSSAANAGSTVGEGGGIGPSPQGIEQTPAVQEKVIRFPDLDPDSFMTVKSMFKMMNEATDRGYKFEVG